MIRKKNIFKTVITCILISSLCLSGCGAGTQDQDTETKNSEAVGSGADFAQPTPSPQPASQEERFRAPIPAQYYIPEGREVVTLGIYGDVYTSSPMYQAVNAFNQAQEKYFVKIEVYNNYGRFIIDIIRKQGTDLYNLFVGIGNFPFVEKGILEDLTPYFEGSDVVRRDDIVDAVWRAGSMDDKLYFLIPYFYCSGILVEKGYAKEGAWSGREYIELGKKYPGSMLNAHIQEPTTQIWTWLREHMAAFVNWEDRTCSFDSEEFIALLEDLKALSSYKYEAVDETATMAGLIRGKTYLSELVILRMNTGMNSYRDIKDAFGDNYEIAGMPTADGSLKYELGYDQIYGMNAASENKEGAWAFLEYLVSEEFQQPYPPCYVRDHGSLLNGHFPARKDSLERGLQANVDYAADPNEGVVHYHTNMYTNERIAGYEGFTEEDKKAILYIIENSYRAAFGRGFSPLDILMEEAEPFFQGQKSAKEVAKIIQNRVSLYLIE